MPVRNSERPRIMQVMGTSGAHGGLERHFLDLCNALSDEYQVIAVSHPAYAKALSANVQFESLGTVIGRRNPFTLWRVASIIRRCQPDVIHAHANCAAEIISYVKRWTSARCIATCHGQKKRHIGFGRFDQIIAVSDVVAAGPPPFDQVKAAVQVAWGLSKGAEQARKLAEQLEQALNRGEQPAAALARLGLADAPRQPLDARRGDINRQGGVIPPPLQALFTLKAGKAKLLPLEQNRGFAIVRLERITPHDPRGDANILASTRGGLANVLGGEYARQFAGAVQRDIGVQRNAAAIAAVEKALLEANGAAPAQ